MATQCCKADRVQGFDCPAHLLVDVWRIMKSTMKLLKSIGSSLTQGAIQRCAANGSIARPRGMVRFDVFERRRLIATIEDHNMFVNAGLPALASLMGGDTSGE